MLRSRRAVFLTTDGGTSVTTACEEGGEEITITKTG